MKQLLVLASLACALSAQPAVAGRAKPPMLSIRYGSETPATTKTVDVFSSGSYVVTTFDSTGKVTGSSRVNLDRKLYTALRSAVVAAQWTVSQNQVACLAYSPSYTQYLVQGDLKFTEQMCSGAVLDATTLQSLSTFKSVLGL